MRKLLVLIAAAFFCFICPGYAADFDCAAPPFGADLQELNKDGAFVKYNEKDDIAYYRFTGPCALQPRRGKDAKIAFAFVDGKLYARLLTFRLPDGTVNVSMKDLLAEGGLTAESLRGNDGSGPELTTKEYTDGDWEVVQVNDKAKKLITKIKYNPTLGLVKAAVYLKPIHDELMTSCSEQHGCELIFD